MKAAVIKTVFVLSLAASFPCFTGLAEELEDTYEAELMQKCQDVADGKKNDEPKNAISRFLSAAKNKIGKTFKKKEKKENTADATSLSISQPKQDSEGATSLSISQPKQDSEGTTSLSISQPKQDSEGTSDENAGKKPKCVSHRPQWRNKIKGDSLNKLGFGTPVYCTLAGVVAHSGIAIGDKIIHLDGDGTIILTSPQEFIDRLNGKNPAINIYYAAYAPNRPVECDAAAARALSQVGKKVDYNVVKKNCHAFTIWCYTGKHQTQTLSIRKIDEVVEKQCGQQWHWRCWDGWR